MRMTDEVTVNGKTYDVTQSDGQYSADGGQTWASNAYAATQAASSNSSSSSGSSGSSSHNYKGYSPSEAWGNQPSDKHKGYSPSDAWSGDSATNNPQTRYQEQVKLQQQSQPKPQAKFGNADGVPCDFIECQQSDQFYI